jgi:hypothetical protein
MPDRDAVRQAGGADVAAAALGIANVERIAGS